VADGKIDLQREDKEDNADIALNDQAALQTWLAQLSDDAVIPAVKKQLAAQEASTKQLLPKPKEISMGEAVTFDKLAAGSFFQGFSYSANLTRLKEDCAQANETGCWAARGLGGTLSYDTAAMPAYLQRIKNYDEAVALRQAMQNITIEIIRVEGQGDKVTGMMIKGISHDRPVYLELSLGDVNQ
jgi:hypothetical protein